jgi:hypothetical protein
MDMTVVVLFGSSEWKSFFLLYFQPSVSSHLLLSIQQ